MLRLKKRDYNIEIYIKFNKYSIFYILLTIVFILLMPIIELLLSTGWYILHHIASNVWNGFIHNPIPENPVCKIFVCTSFAIMILIHCILYELIPKNTFLYNRIYKNELTRDEYFNWNRYFFTILCVLNFIWLCYICSVVEWECDTTNHTKDVMCGREMINVIINCLLFFIYTIFVQLSSIDYLLNNHKMDLKISELLE